MWRIFIQMHCIQSRCDIEPKNILFVGMSVHFQPRHFTGWGSEGVNAKYGTCLTDRRLVISTKYGIYIWFLFMTDMSHPYDMCMADVRHVMSTKYETCMTDATCVISIKWHMYDLHKMCDQYTKWYRFNTSHQYKKWHSRGCIQRMI